VRRPLVGFVLCLILVQPFFAVEEGWTSTFNVSPLQIVLSGKTSSALLEIKNQSTESLRLQLSVSAWDQSPSGEMVLAATEDIILFPSLLTLEAGETRKVRLGTTVPRSGTEKSYRVFVEELPPQQTDQVTGGHIRVLTRLSIPVFLQPAQSVLRGEIADLTVRDATASFEIRNSGNVHFSARHIEVVGLGLSSSPITTHTFEGWYILSGGFRRYDVRLSLDDCRKLRLLTVEVQTELGPLKREATLQPGACGR
jgi:fimbrial chaperone protein